MPVQASCGDAASIPTGRAPSQAGGAILGEAGARGGAASGHRPPRRRPPTPAGRARAPPAPRPASDFPAARRCGLALRPPARRRAMGPERCLALGGLLALAGLLEGRLVRQEEEPASASATASSRWDTAEPAATMAGSVSVPRAPSASPPCTAPAPPRVLGVPRAARLPAPLARAALAGGAQVSQAFPSRVAGLAYAGRFGSSRERSGGERRPGLRCRGPEAAGARPSPPRPGGYSSACLVPVGPAGRARPSASLMTARVRIPIRPVALSTIVSIHFLNCEERN